MIAQFNSIARGIVPAERNAASIMLSGYRVVRGSNPRVVRSDAFTIAAAAGRVLFPRGSRRTGLQIRQSGGAAPMKITPISPPSRQTTLHSRRACLLVSSPSLTSK